MNCPNCSELLSERGYFCKSCGAQARCRQCKELLEPAAIACVECGTKVGEGKPVDGANGGAADTASMAVPANRNTITYREDRNSKDFQASLSDDSMQSVGTLLAEVFAQRGVGRITQHGGPHGFSKEPPLIDALKGLAAPEQHDAKPEQEHQETPRANPELTNVGRIFRADGEILELTEHRLKAKSGMDYVRRLTYLFLFAHELHGRAWVPQAQVFAVLKEGKVWDANTRFWLKKKNGFRIDGEDRYQLLEAGKDDAKKALTEAVDPNAQDEWNPDKKTVQKRGPRKKKN
jgi:hypothetical protein